MPVPVPVPGGLVSPAARVSGSATETAAVLDIIERRKAVSPEPIQTARDLVVRVVSMLARLASK